MTRAVLQILCRPLYNVFFLISTTVRASIAATIPVITLWCCSANELTHLIPFHLPRGYRDQTQHPGQCLLSLVQVKVQTIREMNSPACPLLLFGGCTYITYSNLVVAKLLPFVIAFYNKHTCGHWQITRRHKVPVYLLRMTWLILRRFQKNLS